MPNLEHTHTLFTSYTLITGHWDTCSFALITDTGSVHTWGHTGSDTGQCLRWIGTLHTHTVHAHTHRVQVTYCTLIDCCPIGGHLATLTQHLARLLHTSPVCFRAVQLHLCRSDSYLRERAIVCIQPVCLCLVSRIRSQIKRCSWLLSCPGMHSRTAQ